jgi:outer membrane protein TolC
MIDRLHVLPRVLLLAVLLGPSTSSAGQTPGQGRSPFLGSVPAGRAASETLPLSLKETFDRALTYNLGVIESDKNAQAARAVRLRSLSALLPDVSARVSGTREQINLRALGFNLSLPGVSVPSIAGPFSVADARVYLSQQIFDWSDIQSWRSAAESERASRQSYRSDRDLVVLTTGNAYLAVTSDHATVDSIRAQVTTAKALYDRAVDRNKAGVIAAIDVLRAEVELQTQEGGAHLFVDSAVQVTIRLANRTVEQAHDRLSAGVAGSLDVVQAQESVAAANQSYIASLYAYNLAKISLAQAIGIAERSALTYLGAK